LRSGKFLIGSTKFSRHDKTVWSAGLFFIIMHSIVMLIFNGLPITARQLREFALPGAFHRLIVPVVSMELSRWAAGYGAVFAK
jgi:hypothetical protein